MAIVSPNFKPVLPLAPEMIVRQDGQTKNDCERNAANRLLEKMKADHPRLKFTILEDGLASNAPHIRNILQYDYNYILGAKEGDHKYLFEWIKHDDRKQTYEFTAFSGEKVKKEIVHRFTFVNSVPLNGQHDTVIVNFLDYEEITFWRIEKR